MKQGFFIKNLSIVNFLIFCSGIRIYSKLRIIEKMLNNQKDDESWIFRNKISSSRLK
jgi:hypothetical protein